jgi:hypothetical protein
VGTENNTFKNLSEILKSFAPSFRTWLLFSGNMHCSTLKWSVRQGIKLNVTITMYLII